MLNRNHRSCHLYSLKYLELLGNLFCKVIVRLFCRKNREMPSIGWLQQILGFGRSKNMSERVCLKQINKRNTCLCLVLSAEWSTDLEVFTQKGTEQSKGWRCNKQRLDGRSQTADGSEEDWTSGGILAKQLRDVLKGKHPRGGWVGVKEEVVFGQGDEHLTWGICRIGYWEN